MNAHNLQCMEVWGGNQLADRSVVMPGLDAWVYSKPFGEADGGGDVYYVSSCATGRIVRLLVADVSGHGTPVSALAADLRTLMRRHVNQIDQSQFVRSMNQQFTAVSNSECFATAIVSTFFAPTNHLSFCNAGHPPPLIYRAAKRTWEFIEHRMVGEAAFGNVPLGIIDLANYDQFDIHLKVGDLVVCYTDSFIESHSPDGEMLGQAGLLRLAQELDVSDASRVIPQLLKAIGTSHEGNLSADDVTVLLFRPNGTVPRVTLRDRAMAPVRMVKSFMESLRPGGQPMAWPEFSLANIGGAIIPALNQRWGRGRGG